MTLSGATTICAGLMTNINLSSGPASGNVVYKINNGSNQTIVLDGTGAATISTGTLDRSLTYKLVTVDNGSCIYNRTDSAVVTVNPNTWSGAADSNWNNAANWCGGVPTATTPVLIPTVTRQPIVPTGTTLTNSDFSVASGATVTLMGSSAINVTGNATINGTVIGGSVILDGTSAQTISGKGTVNNIELNNNAGATINTGDTLKVSGVVTLTSGQLNTNNALVLVSDSTGDASIGAITSGTISGNVILQRYIPSGKRLFRFFSHPYSSTVALNPELTSQIDVTGAGGAANGFTTSQTNNASAFWYNPLTGNTNPGGNGNDPGWTAFTSANATSGANGWKPYEGIRVLVRGAKGEGLNGGTYTPSAATIALSGTVNTGTINIPMVVGTNSNCNVIGNPYPSAVNLGGVMYNAYQAGLLHGSAYYVWDAEAGTSGAYITQHITGPTDYYNLPSGGAFVVNAATAGNLTFNETDKVATGDGLFKTTSGGPANRVEFRIYSNHDSIYWDRMYTSFEPLASNGVDNYDGGKAANPGVNFYSIASDGTHLSIDARPFVNNMLIPVGFKTTMPAQTYKIKVQTYALTADHVIYLVDNYLNTVQQMDLGSEYTFSVTSDSLSQGDNRFQLSAMLIDTTTTSVATTTIKKSNALAVELSPNPATVQTSIKIEAGQKGATSISIMNVSGLEVYSVNLGEVSTQSVDVPLQNLAAGIYMVKVTCGSETITKRLVKQ